MKVIRYEVLRSSAVPALQLLLDLQTKSEKAWEESSDENLGNDAIQVLSACKALRAGHQQDNIPIDKPMLFATTQALVDSLSLSAVRKLAIINWHFNTPDEPSDGLHRFLQNPNMYNAVWEAAHQSYIGMTNQDIPLKEFKASHDFLLARP